MAISTEDFVKQIETMTVLDLANLVKALEERFGVSAAAALRGRGGLRAVAEAVPWQDGRAPLQLGKDIKNISGATISRTR